MTDPSTLALLVRHCLTDAIGQRLAGRLPGIHLNEAGRAQAQRLVDRLRNERIDRVVSSPLERATETAQPLAKAHGVEVQIRDDLTEVDFGAWSGLTFDELAQLPAWARFNTQRSNAEVPGGERAIETQARIVRALDDLRERHQGETIAIVSHADVIRAAVLHCVGAPLDLCHRVEIAPASITAIALAWDGPRVLYVNDRDRRQGSSAR